MRVLYSLVGFVEIEVCELNKNNVLNICMENLIPYTDVILDECGNIRMKLKYHDYRRLKRVADSFAVSFSVVRFGGLPAFLLKYKYRYGLMAGLVAACALALYFSSIIWDIRIVGNNSITTAELEGVLASYGVCVGKRISDIDVDKVQNQILIESQDISFIAINLSGNVASVEIIENQKGEDKLSGYGFANVVAKKSGVIEDVRSYVGNVVVKSGQIVNEGDLLISGLYDSNRVGFRYTRAAGEVMAKTVEEYYIEIPLKYEKKQYTGVVNYEKSLNFFGKTFNILKKGGNGVSLYDTIYNVDNCSLPWNTDVPISVTTVSYHEFELVEAERSVDEAETLAYLELERRISSSGAEFVIRKTVTPHVGDDSFSIHCVVVYIENIAQTSEFVVDMQN